MVQFNEGFSRFPKNYLFKELAEKAAQRKAQGKITYKLGIGDPDLPTPWPIREGLEIASKEYHKYPDSEGTKELRQALADRYTKRFPRKRPYNPEDFAIGPGAKSDLFDITQMFSNEGDDVACFSPAYPVFVNRALYEGFNVKFLSATKDNKFLPLPEEQFTSEELDKLKALYLCLPNNPTGAVGNTSYLEKHVESAIEHDYAIIFDSAYIDFCENPFAPNIMQIPGAEDVAIDIGSFSKPFSMTGWRISWTFAEGEIGKKWIQYKSNRDSGTSNYIQKAALTALTNPHVPPLVKNNMMTYEDRKEFSVERHNELKLKCELPLSAPYIYAQVPPGFTSEQFCNILLEKAGVLVTPGSGFGPDGEGYFRSTIFQPIGIIEKAFDEVEKVQKSEHGW